MNERKRLELDGFTDKTPLRPPAADKSVDPS